MDIIYVGRRADVIAECGTLESYEGKYLIQPDGGGNWDAIGAMNKAELEAGIAELRAAYPGLRVCRL